MKVMTSLDISSPVWDEFTIVRPPSSRLLYQLGNSKYRFLRSVTEYLNAILQACAMIRVRKNFEVAITDLDTAGNTFAVLQILTGHRIRHVVRGIRVMHSSNPFYNLFKRIQLRIENKAIDEYVVTSHAAIDYFSRFIGADRKHFTPVLFHTTLKEIPSQLTTGKYLFSGGNGNRDYRTLIEAVRILGVHTVIASTDRSLFRNIDIPPEVTLEAPAPVAFRNLMAGSWFTVVALKYNKLHPGGEQTYLNSMALGKPTIVTNRREAADYIKDGESGFLVEPGYAAGLRKTIKWIIDNPEKAAEIGMNGKKVAEKLTLERWHRGIYDVCEKLLSEEDQG